MGLKNRLGDLPRAILQQVPMSIAIILISLWTFAAHPLYLVVPRIFLALLGFLYSYILVLCLFPSIFPTHLCLFLAVTSYLSADVPRVHSFDVCDTLTDWSTRSQLLPCEAS